MGFSGRAKSLTNKGPVNKPATCGHNAAISGNLLWKPDMTTDGYRQCGKGIE